MPRSCSFTPMQIPDIPAPIIRTLRTFSSSICGTFYLEFGGVSRVNTSSLAVDSALLYL
jgi:hypothetical protein